MKNINSSELLFIDYNYFFFFLILARTFFFYVNVGIRYDVSANHQHKLKKIIIVIKYPVKLGNSNFLVQSQNYSSRNHFAYNVSSIA